MTAACITAENAVETTKALAPKTTTAQCRTPNIAPPLGSAGLGFTALAYKPFKTASNALSPYLQTNSLRTREPLSKCRSRDAAMCKPERIWQLISLVLAGAMIATLIQLHHATTATRSATGTLPSVNKMSGYEHLALSPNARRAHERYSL